ncbi:hypothetical protein [Xanthomonas albilineans]|uniref:hypothetical protein n=1 Tax=Xanthomonas albilineans TaxID=29447 RepID=UPI00126A2631|nr:hypothetical protein [Xanthomonas albilineans]
MRELTAVELDLISGGDDMSGETNPWFSRLSDWALNVYTTITSEPAQSTVPTYTAEEISKFMQQCMSAGGNVDITASSGTASGQGMIRELSAGGQYSYFHLNCNKAR